MCQTTECWLCAIFFPVWFLLLCIAAFSLFTLFYDHLVKP